jgi:hypothetical protein
MRTDLQWTEAMLNPILHEWHPLYDPPESQLILHCILQKMTPDYDAFRQALGEDQGFLEKCELFEGLTDPRRPDLPLHEW